MKLTIERTEVSFWGNELSDTITALSESNYPPTLDIYTEEWTGNTYHIVSDNRITKEGYIYLNLNGITKYIEEDLLKLRNAVSNWGLK